MKRAVSTVAVLGILAATAVAAEDGSELLTAIKSGTVAIEVRARFEQVDQDGFDDDAQATTTRLRLNYKTGQWRNLSGFIEFDHVFNALLTDYDSGAGTSPGKAGQYPVIADPDGSDLNQLYLDYSTDPDWKWRGGRQRILLDNQRFVGGVGWRQNEQTFDAFSLTTTAAKNTTLFYSYIGQVRRIYGQEVAAGHSNVDAHLLNARIKLHENWTLTPYLYYIDDHDALANSTSTAGARIAGNLPLGEAKIEFLGEFATQSDAADAPVSFDADYAHLTVSWTGSRGLSVGLGFESLGGSSDPGEAFRTPLATLHAFNGWADKFLSTPDAGLEDSYAVVKYAHGKWNLDAVMHDFAAKTGGSDYGSELDVSAARKLGERYGLLLKAAFFSADAASSLTDTDKFWVMLTASY
ncbi:MAG: alginate export family protein [Gammaproteobacteria bacterium]|nr:alginate export family protein [Gammaproteobacteria bacterium]MDH5302678.1 alginate export family protein [Gammaproteobacteria bacterium]MDH5320885.1 alginate export family protein [Gammaproteobacteria bacterium]